MSEGRSGVRPFSAKRPERVRALIRYGSYSCMAGGSWDDVDRDPAELRSGVTSVDPELDEKYCRRRNRSPASNNSAALSVWG
jgi:hypothetical protein